MTAKVLREYTQVALWLELIGPVGISGVIFGAITLGTAWATTWGHILACRILLGLFEGGMFPAMTVWVSPSSLAS